MSRTRISSPSLSNAFRMAQARKTEFTAGIGFVSSSETYHKMPEFFNSVRFPKFDVFPMAKTSHRRY
jgi:hypothetical protein